LKAFAEGPSVDHADASNELFAMADKKSPGLRLTRYLASVFVYGKQHRLATLMSKKKKKKKKEKKKENNTYHVSSLYNDPIQSPMDP
jgi:hypothetical protein